jgi:hypothetical protein
MKNLFVSALLFISFCSYGQKKDFILKGGVIQKMEVYDSTAATASVTAKLNKSDTSSMLSAYQTAINSKISTVDANAAIGSINSAIALKVNISDTASMLSAYQTAYNARLKLSDTSSMLSAYRAGLLAKAPSNGSYRIKWAQGNGNGSAIAVVGWTITAVGTATNFTPTVANRYTQSPGQEYLVTVAATNAVAGWRETQGHNFFGSSPGDGGFKFICRFGPATGVSTATNRSFTGMSISGGVPTDVNPSTLLSMIGIAWDDTDANIQFMHNDGGGTASKVDLGIPVPSVDRTSFFELIMVVQPNSSSVTYSFKDMQEGGATVTGTVNTNLPPVNTFLLSRGWISTGGTSSVIGYGLKYVAVETNF